MKNTFKITGVALMLAFGPVAAFQAMAQGGGVTGEYVIDKSKAIVLPEASRNFEKFKIEPPEKETKSVTYRFNDFKLPDQDVNLSVRVLTIRQDDLTKLYGNYVKAGYGNYNTPYLKGYFHNKRSDQASYGATLSHISSNGPVEESGVSKSEIGANGEAYMGNLTIGGRGNYQRDSYKFYGFNRASAEGMDRMNDQGFNRVGAEAYVNNNQEASAKMQYHLGGGLKYFSDEYDVTETNGFANLNLNYYLSSKSRVAVISDFSYISYNDVTKTSRPFFRLRPSYQMDLDKLDISIGGTLAYADDNVTGADKLNLYPALRVGYEVIENKMVAFGGLGGDLQRVSVFELTRENPWLSSSYNLGPNTVINPPRRSLDVRNIDNQIEIYGGLTGSLASNVQVTAKVAYRNLNNLYFFNHSERDSSRFILVYDNDAVSNVNFFGEILYNRSDKMRFGAKMDYNTYSVSSLEEAFYRPSTFASVFGTYNLYNKILFNAELYYIGSSFGMIQREFGTRSIRETDKIVDLNLKVDYRFSEKFSTFVMLNNVLGKKYERFLNYPQNGFNAIVGLSYIF